MRQPYLPGPIQFVLRATFQVVPYASHDLRALDRAWSAGVAGVVVPSFCNFLNYRTHTWWSKPVKRSHAPDADQSGGIAHRSRGRGRSSKVSLDLTEYQNKARYRADHARRSDKQKIAELIAIHGPVLPDFGPSRNVAPQTFQPVVRLNRDTGERGLVLMRWVLCPIGYCQRIPNESPRGTATCPVPTEGA